MSTYLEECIDAVRSIDVTALAVKPLGKEIGKATGSEFDFHILGQQCVSQVLQWVGIKGPRSQNSDPIERLRREVRFINQCIKVSPELRPLVPSFMGLLAVEGSEARALITEDASCGSSVEVRGAPVSEESTELIRAAFTDFGEGRRLITRELERTTGFNVAGRERLLDFTPPPVCYKRVHEPDWYAPLLWEIDNALDSLTITLSLDSTLGRDLHDQYANFH